jgi:hypothetical protein
LEAEIFPNAEEGLVMLVLLRGGRCNGDTSKGRTLMNMGSREENVQLDPA